MDMVDPGLISSISYGVSPEHTELGVTHVNLWMGPQYKQKVFLFLKPKK